MTPIHEAFLVAVALAAITAILATVEVPPGGDGRPRHKGACQRRHFRRAGFGIYRKSRVAATPG
jgi:hypothetical protein